MAIKNLPFIRTLFKGGTDTPMVNIGGGAKVPMDELVNGGLIQRYSYEDIQEYVKISQELMQRYRDYEDMDDDPIISSAFNIYADDVTQIDYRTKSTVWVESTDEKTEKTIGGLFDRISIESEIWEIARTLAKYGNDFELIQHDDNRVNELDFISPALIRRYEYGDKVAFAVDPRARFTLKDKEVVEKSTEQRMFENVMLFENWEILHLRLRTKNRGSRYGYGVAEGARSAWKRLMLLEDATMLYKLTRAPNRYVFYVRTGNKPPKEQRAILKEYQKEYRKKKYIDPTTGRLSLKNNPLSSQEDLWVPLQDGKDPSRIETFPSLDFQSMDELDYFKNKLFAGLGVPKRFLTYDETADSRTASSNEDIRFARSVLRLQREIISGLNKVIGVDYALRGEDYSDLNYVVKMTVPSTAFEIAQLEVENTKVAIAAGYDAFVSKEWILTRILGLSEVEATKILTKKRSEMKADLAAQQAGLGAAGGVETGYESKLDKWKNSRDYALLEKKWDKRLDEIKDSAIVNSKKFRELKALILETRNLMYGVRLNGKDGSSMTVIDEGEGKGREFFA
jgi:hypothetical protein